MTVMNRSKSAYLRIAKYIMVTIFEIHAICMGSYCLSLGSSDWPTRFDTDGGRSHVGSGFEHLRRCSKNRFRVHRRLGKSVEPSCCVLCTCEIVSVVVVRRFSIQLF